MNQRGFLANGSIVQAVITGVKVDSFPLQQEAQRALPIAQRVTKCAHA